MLGTCLVCDVVWAKWAQSEQGYMGSFRGCVMYSSMNIKVKMCAIVGFLVFADDLCSRLCCCCSLSCSANFI